MAKPLVLVAGILITLVSVPMVSAEEAPEQQPNQTCFVLPPEWTSLDYWASFVTCTAGLHECGWPSGPIPQWATCVIGP